MGTQITKGDGLHDQRSYQKAAAGRMDPAGVDLVVPTWASREDLAGAELQLPPCSCWPTTPAAGELVGPGPITPAPLRAPVPPRPDAAIERAGDPTTVLR